MTNPIAGGEHKLLMNLFNRNERFVGDRLETVLDSDEEKDCVATLRFGNITKLKGFHFPTALFKYPNSVRYPRDLAY